MEESQLDTEEWQWVNMKYHRINVGIRVSLFLLFRCIGTTYCYGTSFFVLV